MEAISKIHNFARRVMWRRRLLSLQDTLALGLLAGGLICAALVFYIRWKAIHTPVWVVALVVFSAVFAALLTRWSISRASENDAGFLIDEALNLEDRFATSQAIINKSKVENEVEKALLEDASGRIEDVKIAAIVPYRMKKFYALSALALIAFTTTVMMPQKSLPGGEELVQTQADIQAAGEQLEKTSTEIEKFVPPETVTAGLAKEQAELGRSLRRSSDTRAEALKKLSSLEDRIRQRQDELKSTRADEIVALAQKRMGTALSQMGNRNIQQSASEKEQVTNSESANNSASRETQASEKRASSDKAGKGDAYNKVANDKTADTKVDGKNRQTDKRDAKNSVVAKMNQIAAEKNKTDQNTADKDREASNQKSADVAKQKQTEQKNSGQNQIAENQKSEGEKNSTSQKPNPNDAQNGKQQPEVTKNTSPENSEVGKNPNDQKQQPENPGQQEDKNPAQEQPDSKEQEQNQDASNPLTKAIAEQTTKALSEQLLKKAEDLKAGKMSAEDIKKLALSAAQLAKDLAPIAQSKDFQKALEQMAKQINPQQLEQIARELMKDEKLQRELKAAAKLLWENRQVKDMVAGLTKTAAEIEADMRQQGGEKNAKPSPDGSPNQQSEPITFNSKADSKGQQKGATGQGTQTARAEGERKLAGKGREAKISGQMQNRPGGDYVYSGVKPGAGAARVPYSSAYPQYRRQAERTVERSQVPTQMRSMIRNYFDAINPNGKN